MRYRLVALLAVAMLMALPSAAVAHAELVSSDPTAGATLDDAPTEVVLTFDGELSPDGSLFTVLNGGGVEVGRGELDLEVADRNVLRGSVLIEADGRYDVQWVAISEDGHPEEGSFSFRVGPPPIGAPDTALPHPSPAAPLGVLLVVLAAVAIRRAIRHARLGQ